MSFQEKRTIASLVSGFIVLVIYCIYAYIKVLKGVVSFDNINFWAVTMLIFIAIGIVSTIIIQICFHILFAIGISIKSKIEGDSIDDEKIKKIFKVETIEDERDKLVELKSERIGYAFGGIGFVVSLFVLAFDGLPSLMLNIMFLSFLVGNLLEGFAQLYHYKKGF